VRGTAPGDVVEVAITDLGRLLEGRLLQIIEPGRSRVATRCVHVDECGGCQWQQVSIEAQREAKRSNLIEALVRIARIPRERLPEVGLVASPQDFRYRRRARFMVEMRTGQLGYAGSEGRPHVVLRECHLLVPPLERLMLRLSAVLRESPLRPRHVEACAVEERTAVLLELDSPATPVKMEALARRVMEAITELSGVVVRTGAEVVEVGTPDLSTFGGTTYLRPDAFGQANQAVNEKLVQAALEALSPSPADRVLELFCGNGNFTLPLGERAREVVAVEESSISLKLLRRALEQAGLGNVLVQAGQAASVAHDMAWKGERFDLALLDPPRVGAKELLEDLTRLCPRSIAYVSCDPATLARDLKTLLAHGYRLEQATVFDQFPQTYHLEALALLVRPG